METCGVRANILCSLRVTPAGRSVENRGGNLAPQGADTQLRCPRFRDRLEYRLDHRKRSQRSCRIAAIRSRGGSTRDHRGWVGKALNVVLEAKNRIRERPVEEHANSDVLAHVPSSVRSRPLHPFGSVRARQGSNANPMRRQKWMTSPSFARTAAAFVPCEYLLRPHSPRVSKPSCVRGRKSTRQ